MIFFFQFPTHIFHLRYNEEKIQFLEVSLLQGLIVYVNIIYNQSKPLL